MAPHQRLQALEGHMRGVSVACLLLARARHLVWWSLSFCKEEEKRKRERGERDRRTLLTNLIQPSNMATELEQALAQGVQDAKIPHAVVYATNKDGK